MEENHGNSSENGAANPDWVAEAYLVMELTCKQKLNRQRKSGVFHMEGQLGQRGDVTGLSKPGE